MRTSSGATQLCSGCGGRDFSDAEKRRCMRTAFTGA